MIKQCKNCEKEFTPKDYRQIFCSQSCAATYNNKKYPKRTSEYSTECPICGSKKHYKAKTCLSCKKEKEIERIRNKTLKEHSSNGNARIKWDAVRKHARLEMERSGVEKKCKICGFDLYVEVCHIKPISSFSEDTRISEVNSPNKNLIYLCPNHHIMFDRGLLGNVG